MYQRPISGIREGSIGAIIYFGVPCLFFEKKNKKRKCVEKWQEDIGTSIWKRWWKQEFILIMVLGNGTHSSTWNYN